MLFLTLLTHGTEVVSGVPKIHRMQHTTERTHAVGKSHSDMSFKAVACEFYINESTLVVKTVPVSRNTFLDRSVEGNGVRGQWEPKELFSLKYNNWCSLTCRHLHKDDFIKQNSQRQ